MQFSLRRQLTLIGLVTLALPVLSALYVRETESALRDAQTGFLANIASGVAAAIAPVAAATDLAGGSDASLFLLPLQRQPVLDGFVDDWGLDGLAPALRDAGPLRVRTAVHEGTIWLYAEWHGSGTGGVRWQFACGGSGEFFTTFTTASAGAFNLASELGAGQVRGVWQPGADRSRLELRIPGGLCRERLGLSARSGERFGSTFEGSAPGPLLRPQSNLTAALRAHTPPGITSFVTDANGWRVTSVVNEPDALQVAVDPEATGGLAGLYRRLLGDADGAWPIGLQYDQRRTPAIQWALEGTVAHGRAMLAGGDAPLAVALAAVPLQAARANAGSLVLLQESAAILTLANPSLMRLTTGIIATTMLIVALLLAYATWLSLRVRRLAAAANAAIDARGELVVGLPGRGAPDEIGNLARDFDTLLDRVAEQQRWLREIADKLSHELRTPLAIVQSSLDNLQHSDLDAGQQELSDRAADGVQRLRAILNAMSNANRAEQAARAAEHSDVDLSALVEQLADAYAQTFPSHRFRADATAAAPISGAPDLLVQMLDKLVENAVSFAPAGSVIELTVSSDERHVELSVTNIGPPLPPHAADELFLSFYSRRADAGGAHLGFGLYNARLIADAHGAEIDAQDVLRDGQTAVRFRVRFARLRT